MMTKSQVLEQIEKLKRDKEMLIRKVVSIEAQIDILLKVVDQVPSSPRGNANEKR